MTTMVGVFYFDAFDLKEYKPQETDSPKHLSLHSFFIKNKYKVKVKYAF